MNNPYMELAAAISDREDWRERAVCRDADDPDQWFTDGKDDRGNRRKVAEAKAICRTCPVQIQCLDFARSTHQRFGVWGGEKMIEPSNRERTSCIHGHDYTPETVYLDSEGHRRCTICRAAYQERANRVRREKRLAASAS